jgi:proteasome lid subunit RPN8/RPN11
LVLTTTAWNAMVAHCVLGAPLEACGLLVGTPAAGGPPGGTAGNSPGGTLVAVALRAVNEAASARVYTVRPIDLLRAGRRAEEMGGEVVGVYHSHTHTEAYPSPTDVAAAPDPGWHYVVVSLRDTRPTTRSYRIIDGKIEEESVVLE